MYFSILRTECVQTDPYKIYFRYPFVNKIDYTDTIRKLSVHESVKSPSDLNYDTIFIGDLAIPRSQLKPQSFLNIPEIDMQLYDITTTPPGVYSFDIRANHRTVKIYSSTIYVRVYKKLTILKITSKFNIGALGLWVIGYIGESDHYTTRFFSWKYNPEYYNSLRVLRFADCVEIVYLYGKNWNGEKRKLKVKSGKQGICKLIKREEF